MTVKCRVIVEVWQNKSAVPTDVAPGAAGGRRSLLM